MRSGVIVRPMQAGDREATLDLWVEAWRDTYPAIDFAARRDWMDRRFDEFARAGTQVLVAVHDGNAIGFVTIDPANGYLDQLVVAKAYQRRRVAALLLAQVRKVAPQHIELHVNQDNHRAVAFYRKHGFGISGTDVTRLSGAPTYKMTWRG